MAATRKAAPAAREPALAGGGLPPGPPPRAAEAAPAVREPIRQPIQEIPGRVIGLRRDGSPVQRAAAETGVNEFFVPPHLPPPGWSWEWKEETVHGEVRQGYAAKLQMLGWEPVMYEQHPGIFAPEYEATGKKTVGPVRRGGLILMERDIRLTQEAMIEDRRKAAERAGNAKRQYSVLDTRGTETAEIDHSARRMSGIQQTYEPAPDPRGRQPVD